jgi:hypothetical protein
MRVSVHVPIGALSLIGDVAIIAMLRLAAGDEFEKLAGCWCIDLVEDGDLNARLVAACDRRVETVIERLHTLERLAARLSQHASDQWPRGVMLRECPYVALAAELAAVTRVAATARNSAHWNYVRGRWPAVAAPMDASGGLRFNEQTSTATSDTPPLCGCGSSEGCAHRRY